MLRKMHFIIEIRGDFSRAECLPYGVVVQPFAVIRMIISFFVPLIDDHLLGAFCPYVRSLCIIRSTFQCLAIHAESQHIVFPSEIVETFGYKTGIRLCRKGWFSILLYYR